MDGDAVDRAPDPAPRGNEAWRGKLLVLQHESMDELVEDLHADDIERLDMRLAFEAWADGRS